MYESMSENDVISIKNVNEQFSMTRLQGARSSFIVEYLSFFFFLTHLRSGA